MRARLPTLRLMAVAATISSLACDTFKTCSDARVDLVNGDQNTVAVHVVPPGEDPSPENLLEPGQSRRIELCLSKADRRGFRVVLENDTLAQANCVASMANYEALVIQVHWGPGGLACLGW